MCPIQQLPSYPPTSHTGKRNKEIIPFTIASKGRKEYLGINPTKDIKSLYDEYFKILTEEIEEDPGRQQETLSSWIGKINTVKNVHSTKSNVWIQVRRQEMGQTTNNWDFMKLKKSLYHRRRY